VSEVETGDRIREPGARIHRAGVVQVRPILEQFVPRREVAIIEDRTELFEKIQITDRLRTFEHRQVDEDKLRAMGFRLASDFFNEEVIFAAIDPGERARDHGSWDWLARLREKGRSGNRMLHVDQLPEFAWEAGAEVGAVFRVVLRIELLREAKQIGKEIGAEQLEFADR
jgi:hypothetical protein